jgi:hypothetical protein
MKRQEIKWENQLDNIEEYEGFIYKIINKETGISYIGKKSYWSRTSKKVEGKKNRKRFLNESDWRKYTSSNIELKKQIKEQGMDKFNFIILRHCKNKREHTYYEVFYQFQEDVLNKKLDNGNYEYLNDNILGKFFRAHLQEETIND